MNENRHTAERHPLGSLMKPMLIVGIIAGAILAFGGMSDTESFFRGWLYGFVFCTMISAGCIGLLMIHNLTGGVWGLMIRRIVEAGARTMPLMLLMLIPLLFGIHSIYEWSHADVVAADPILQHKVQYMNTFWFSVRSLVFVGLWSMIGIVLVSLSRKFETEPTYRTLTTMRRISAGGLIFMALSLTLASVDWMMSLEPHWFSTMYGISFLVGCLLSAMAFSIMVVSKTWIDGHYSGLFTGVKLRDLGNLQLAFVMLWAYTAYSQFMLIWYGNLQEEVPYYLRRTEGGWGWMAGALIVFHFFLPFFVLLMRKIKDRPQTIRFVALLLLVMHAVDLYWLIAPAFATGEFYFNWMYPVALIATFGIWATLFFWNLGQGSVVPDSDPWIRERVAARAVNHG